MSESKRSAERGGEPVGEREDVRAEPEPEVIEGTPDDEGGDGDDEVEIIDVEEGDEPEGEPDLPDFVDDGVGEESPSTSKALVKSPGGAAPAIADPLTRYIHQVRDIPTLDRDEEQDLARRFHEEGDRDAAARLISANLMLVVKLALMYRRAMRNVMDLIQEGNVGLMEALKRFDPEQGVKFSTYAAWWIKAYMLKFLMDNARLVRVGTTNARRKLLYNLRKEQRKLEAQGIVPTTKLLAEKFGVSEQDVDEIDQALASPDASVDAPLTDEGSFSFADVLPAADEGAEDKVVRGDIRERVDVALREFRRDLAEREEAIVAERLLADEPVTLQELGDRFGVTREAMRQSEAKLKKRLAGFLKKRLGDEVVLHFSGGNQGG
jgi:RNA polymerase sigma-32 factor